MTIISKHLSKFLIVFALMMILSPVQVFARELDYLHCTPTHSGSPFQYSTLKFDFLAKTFSMTFNAPLTGLFFTEIRALPMGWGYSSPGGPMGQLTVRAGQSIETWLNATYELTSIVSANFQDEAAPAVFYLNFSWTVNRDDGERGPMWTSSQYFVNLRCE